MNKSGQGGIADTLTTELSHKKSQNRFIRNMEFPQNSLNTQKPTGLFFSNPQSV